ncbi:GtrA family protein [Bacillus sp. SM2101]|uniref:GtrA family protein n=1 Tax=Bacillus sp. SM2101 TaxID=2805366 RepID=UPI002032EACF|nr:GtrA family protein [Bacillus sp. SM2101]
MKEKSQVVLFMNNKGKRFLKFSIVGGINTGIDFAIFSLLIAMGMNYLIAQIISYGGGLLNSYLLNRSWTFQQQGRVEITEVVKFILVNFITIVITSILLALLYNELNLQLLLSKLIVTGFGVFINFIGNQIWVFKNSEERGESV